MFGYEIFFLSILAPNLCSSSGFMQLKYPSALAYFEKITTYAKGKKIVLFLDYDGTLSPIVDNPDQAFMSNHVRIYSVMSTFLESFSQFLVGF